MIAAVHCEAVNATRGVQMPKRTLGNRSTTALQRLPDDPRWVGGTLGILAVLHTWTRDLTSTCWSPPVD